LGVLCLFFAHFAGRSAAAVRAGRQKKPRLYGWIIRTMLCGAALLFRHSFDLVALVVYALAALSFGFGFWDQQRPRKRDDLTRDIFPDSSASYRE
jgi:hypothetical protein